MQAPDLTQAKVKTKPASPLLKQTIRPTSEEVTEQLAEMNKPKGDTVSEEKKHKLGPARLELADQRRTLFHAVVEKGTPYEAIFDVTGHFWSSYAPKITRGDLIEVQPDDETWWALVKVTGSNQKNAATVIELVKRDLPRIAVGAPNSPYDIEHLGPHLQWCVIRKSDGARVKERFTTDGDAMMWVAQNRRVA